MAPYVMTPTSEREQALDQPDHSFMHEVSSGGEATPTSSASDTDGPIRNRAIGDPTSSAGQMDSGSTAVNLNGSTPPSDHKYEDAYAHGYKDGYTLAHVELKHQHIAIIGMSCRLPGSVSTPDEFWALLAQSRTGFSNVPASRFSDKRVFHPNPGKSGSTNAHGGNFLTHDSTAFDAPFFGFTQQEAISLDPQQRLLLECTFEALESAGIPEHEVVGNDIGFLQ